MTKLEYSLKTLDDRELMMWYQLSVERKQTRYIKEIKAEMARREREK